MLKVTANLLKDNLNALRKMKNYRGIIIFHPENLCALSALAGHC